MVDSLKKKLALGQALGEIGALLNSEVVCLLLKTVAGGASHH